MQYSNSIGVSIDPTKYTEKKGKFERLLQIRRKITKKNEITLFKKCNICNNNIFIDLLKEHEIFCVRSLLVY